MLVALVIIGSIYVMYDMTKKELAPTEDQSILFFMATAPQTATIDYDIHYVKQVQQIFEQIPEYKESFILAGFGGDPSSTFGGFKMAQPSERERSQSDIQPQLQGALGQVPGFQTVIFPRPSLPTPGNGIPVEFVIVSDMEVEELNGLADQLLGPGHGQRQVHLPVEGHQVHPPAHHHRCRPRPRRRSRHQHAGPRPQPGGRC